MSGAFDKWAEFYVKSTSSGADFMWPSETLIRLFRGPYVADMPKDFSGRSVLEVGCGNGNNMVFLASLGLELHATEVHDDICRVCSERLARLGYDADVRVGTNRNLPFADAAFDYLVSWNVVHYEDNEADMRSALAEYRRVLKPGGRLFVSTTGPEHKILNGAETLGAHRYRIGRQDDFRKGQVFFYFDAPNYIHHYFGEHFESVLVGRTRDMLFTETLDSFVISGVRPRTHTP